MFLAAGLLGGAHGAERIHHGIVPFMARVFEDRARSLLHWDFRSPWPLKRLRIIDGESIQQRVRIDSCESFNQTHVLAGASEVRLVRKVRGLDDEGIAFPMTARISEPLV